MRFQIIAVGDYLKKHAALGGVFRSHKNPWMDFCAQIKSVAGRPHPPTNYINSQEDLDAG